MTTKISKALLLALLMLGTSLVMFTPPADAQAAVAYSISFTNGQVQLDVRPGASGIGCTEMVISNEGQATIDVDIALSGGGVTISPGAVSVTLAPGGSITVPVCALALTRSSYKTVQVNALASGRETNTQLNQVNKNAGFAVIVQQYARLSVQASQPFQKIGPGKEFVLNFIAVNNGNYQDTIAVEVLNAKDLEDAGFTVALAAAQYQIDASGEQPVQLTVATPRGTVVGWSNEYHTVILQVATTLQGETEARSVTATLWIRGVFLPGFDPIFTIFALGMVATALSRTRKD
ncbi:MAG: choice-of-anchor T family protein [Candidatus Thermoplasmatota archaeon]|nr:choice-of-anchor T family protein [Candidatus Thermoplasmatota archaeon]MEC7697891.1 choice-of-anchor T family protein [Candidatus Thermoplasmatota archaeon]MEC8077020.1 choice-of-anchor T family protein [Candidatus Thermoplasmatota archaeon]MEC8446121.1 choice-of-anchor T family protein [Candidatus Thermoplasmatota archaeon]MEE3082047.1 choice-of-anchor T family protein [Candidatus Thermoplasmatota archaeon]